MRPRRHCGNSQIHLNSLISVSYTHLDVYKRQDTVYDNKTIVPDEYLDNPQEIYAR